jgi:hypothetical protein
MKIGTRFVHWYMTHETDVFKGVEIVKLVFDLTLDMINTLNQMYVVCRKTLVITNGFVVINN